MSLHPKNLKWRTSDKETQSQSAKHLDPPVIQVITRELRDEKNLFKINIISEAPIDDCKITFPKDDAKKTVDCVKDIGTAFKSLTDSKQLPRLYVFRQEMCMAKLPSLLRYLACCRHKR